MALSVVVRPKRGSSCPAQVVARRRWVGLVGQAAGMEVAIRHVLPFQSENRWSDLLAALVATDCAPLLHLLELDLDPLSLSVRREVKASDTDRHDIVLWCNGRACVVVEVKVLSGLGRAQLARYEESAPGADLYVIVYPAGLVVDTSGSPRWRPVTWESVLSAHVESSNRWVADTARAWLAHIAAELPQVDASTVWNRLRDGEGFVTAMKTRISWMYSNLAAPEPLVKRLVSSSAGNSAVVGLGVPAPVEGYTLQAEVEERMGVRSIPKYASRSKPPSAHRRGSDCCSPVSPPRLASTGPISPSCGGM